jgi:hypothetical protein
LEPIGDILQEVEWAPYLVFHRELSLTHTWSERRGEEEALTPEQNRNLVTKPVASHLVALKLKTIISYMMKTLLH